jgi:hypothetical protein
MDVRMSADRVNRLAAVLSLSALLLTGCGTNGGEVDDSLTWQTAKKETQATALEIAQLIPSEQVALVEQNPEGVLLSCDSERHQWTGLLTITVAEGASVTDIVASLADHFRSGDEYTLDDYGSGDSADFQLIAKDREENYIIGPGIRDGQVEVSAASTCFTLPDEVYPGGKF